MIHDFATASRQQEWPPARRAAELEATARRVHYRGHRSDANARWKSPQAPTNQKEQDLVLKRNRMRLVLVSTVFLVLSLFIAQRFFVPHEPQFDPQPDAAAKKEYVESVLLDSVDFTVQQDTDQLVDKVDPISSPVTASVQSVANDRGIVASSSSPANHRAAAKSVSPESASVKKEVQAEGIDPGYGFYDSLRQDSWPVPIDKGAYVDGELSNREKPVYRLQAASFRNKDDAYRFVQKLKKRELSASVAQSVSSNGVYWYQVSVGPFVNMSKMNKAQDILVSLNTMPLKRRIN
ncbi:MAG: SPOR domain-containing protein [Pseudomonadales bacterium]|nr:SPOR domain-containing protein [Pseudomonadales bacterium]